MKTKNKDQQQNQLVGQLRRLNQKLNTINLNKSRFFIYNANPFKFALYNFIAGVFHSLGTLFGTIVIAAVLFYFISTIDFIKPLTDWIEEIGSQLKPTHLDWNFPLLNQTVNTWFWLLLSPPLFIFLPFYFNPSGHLSVSQNPHPRSPPLPRLSLLPRPLSLPPHFPPSI